MLLIWTVQSEQPVREQIVLIQFPHWLLLEYMQTCVYYNAHMDTWTCTCVTVNAVSQ